MTVTLAPTARRRAKSYTNAAEWLSSLGDVPLKRIVMDPAPGTATEADLLRLVERDKRLCELLDGTLVEKTVGSWESIIAAKVVFLLSMFVNERKLGAVGGADSLMRMKSRRVRMPDACFISAARLPKTRDAIFNLSPDLVVEVLSEDNSKKEIQQKLVEYFKSGTRLAWVIDPASRTAAVHHDAKRAAEIIDEQGFLEGEPVLPGLRFPLSEVFVNVPR